MKATFTIRNLEVQDQAKVEAVHVSVQYTVEELIALYKAMPEVITALINATK